MKRVILASSALLSLTLGLSQSAIADHSRGFFVGLSALGIESDFEQIDSNESETAQWFGAELNLGYKYNSLLGIDLRYSATSSEQTISGEGSDNEVRLGIDGITAAYYRPELINREAKLYALIGHASVDFTSSSSVGEVSSSESGGSFGFGVGWFVNDNLTFNIELRRLLEGDDNEFDAISLGYDYRF